MIQAWLTDSKIMFFFMFTSSDRGLAVPWQDKGAERKSNDGISLLYHLIRYEVKDMLLVAVNISPNCNKCSGGAGSRKMGSVDEVLKIRTRLLDIGDV
ncbi:hypothetical protein [Serratia quinivorans]|uniref:hypothetical protein n=1 Tax=Serratia quinivorans TaxID=137545 RepID=UPI0021BB93B3|nr:hypothetical protein [Serratia quinivorans]